ncbi:ABC transporter ATP-binding protein [Verrucomicrobiaceae bacterium 227]
MSEQIPILSIDNLSRYFGEFRAVDQLNLSVGAGEIVGLLGPNGAGKTTTVKMLMGMMRQTSGELSLFGLDCFQERTEVQKRVGYLPDEPNFQSHLRGIELLEFVGKVRGLSPDLIRGHIDTVGEKLGLVDDLGEYAANFSKGMRKKLAFLMATVHKPDLLIMDEPTNGLDPVATRAFLEVVQGYVASGTGVLYSTHLLDQAEKICHRCVIMNRGKLVAEGTVAQLKAASAVTSLEEVFFAVTGETESHHA